VLTLPPTVRIYIAREPVDCRKSYDGLSGLVRSVFGKDPLCGHLFVFINRRADQVLASHVDAESARVLAPAA
jgi:transposase